MTRHRIHEYKQPNRVNTHARIKHVLSVCPNAQNIADQTREQRKCFKMFYRMFDRVQILPNTLKHVKTCLNSTKQGGQTEKCFANQQCFSMFYRKTFTVWTGLKESIIFFFCIKNYSSSSDFILFLVLMRIMNI